MTIDIDLGGCSKRKMMSLEVYSTIIKYGDNKGTRGCLLRRDHRQSTQVG